MTRTNGALIPEQGWHCLHLFYRIEFGQWQLLARGTTRGEDRVFRRSCRSACACRVTQLLTLSVVTPKADLGFMLITPDLHAANRIEKQLCLALGADVLIPVYSYLSLTEESEYATTDEEYAKTFSSRSRMLDTGLARIRSGMARLRAIAWQNTGTSAFIRPCRIGRSSVSTT